MYWLSILAIALSALGVGFGAVVLKSAKAVSVWGVKIFPDNQKMHRKSVGVFSLSAGATLLLVGVGAFCYAGLQKCIVYNIMCLILCVVSSVLGIVWGDFLSSKCRKFSQSSLKLLQNSKVVTISERFLETAFAAIIGFDGIKFIEKDGKVLSILYFQDFGFAQLDSMVQTDALCQYFKNKYPLKEVHGLSNKL